MTRTIIAYGTTTGNTEILAEAIEDTLKRFNGNVEVSNVTDIQPADLASYDLILLGCSTWGEGELQDDFIAFEDKMKDVDLSGKKAACFGPGDSDYSLFCEAVTILENRLIECGAQVIVDGLMIDGDVDSQLDLAEQWAEEVHKAISS